MSKLRRDNSTLSNGQNGQLEAYHTRVEDLEYALKGTTEKIRELERSNGVGEGISELNHAVKQELDRLRLVNNTAL